MPKSEYFKGKGAQVHKKMVAKYGKAKGERVFYATANKQNQTPKKSKH